MISRYCKIVLFLICLVAGWSPLRAQRLIQYEAGMGTRDPNNADVWILYQRVRAKHEGMVLYADSALLDTKKNDFTAYGHIHIILSDTTNLWGDQLYYDGNYRIVNIWGDTVLLKDGKTQLRSDNIEYDRNQSKATYSHWGRGNSRGDSLVSTKGVYDAIEKSFHISGDVVLYNKDSRLFTDTLVYYTREEKAEFVSATEIFHDTSYYLYSEKGCYYTGSGRAESEKASYLENGPQTLTCDTLYYNDKSEYGQAFGHVYITDTVNEVFCNGRYGETDQQKGCSYVTDSALVRYVSNGDTLFVHADTIFVANDTAQQLDYIKAYRGVRIYRSDAQAVCDSVYYSAADSTINLYEKPILWYGSYQCSADTIKAIHDSAGVRLAFLEGGSFAIEKVDSLKFNQVKGKRTVVYFKGGEPDYADILGSAEMVYYITEEGEAGGPELIGVNVGVGSDMRIYMENRKAKRVVTYGEPDMHTYPLMKLPDDKSRLKDFRWQEDVRPKDRQDVFRNVKMAE